ncbi:MAG: bifunctional hydroxymethylpyrimidine kinase/phosphomethylpyrimidine kinase [Nitrososphaerota archaeon]|nr:bifunctional hydroxymethylpyrimidine kinase/phosphomethylpyrimidine kinase [Nitrososphaerota archaeon]
MVYKALTIAGSDSGGGAGIQADLKTFHALEVYGLTVITAVTAQNTVEVRDVYPLPAEFVRCQLETVAYDIGFDSAKTGMIYSGEQVDVIAGFFYENPKPLVVDPVFRAAVGADLTTSRAYEALKRKLIPLATVVTPNIDEASIIAGFKVENLSDAVRAAEAIAELGCGVVVVKGGHLRGDRVVDVVYRRGRVRFLESARVEGGTHGAGCSFSAAITAYIARGLPVDESIDRAKEFIVDAIRFSEPVGKGVKPVNPLATLYRDSGRFEVISMLEEALARIERLEGFSKLIPEVRSNLVMSLPYPRGSEDVAGFPSRISPYRGGVKAFSKPEFGASRHLARAILELQKLGFDIRSAINLRYSEELVEVCRRLGFRVGFYDRREEPEDIKRVEGATIPWGIRRAVESIGGSRPDVIYHTGDWGKEPMVLILGRDPFEVVDRLEVIVKAISGDRRGGASDTPGSYHRSS